VRHSRPYMFLTILYCAFFKSKDHNWNISKVLEVERSETHNQELHFQQPWRTHSEC